MKKNTTIAPNHISLHTYLGTVVLLAILSAILPIADLYAQSYIVVTPKRVVFEGNKAGENVYIANSGKDTTRYVISFVHFRMKEDGSFEEISQKEAGQLSAEPYIRYFPRTVTLPPNQAQAIRLQFKKPQQMATGEYRSHLYVRSLPNPAPLGEKDTAQTTSISVKLVPVFGITIPVIIRVGESNTQVSITGLNLRISATEPPILSFTLNRSGNTSIYGDIYVKHLDLTGKSTVVGTVKGLAVYTPNPLRQLQLSLDKTRQEDCHAGKLVVQFITQVNGKDKKMAEAELSLQ